MLVIKKIPHVLFSSVLIGLGGCQPAPDSVPISLEDYCANKKPTMVKPLSKFIEPYQEQLENQSGVYVLEQGAEAIMSRAWLTERAEKSIDIQYFIFSTDNVGLIAADYLVKAAQRGVKVRVLIDDIMLEARGDELLMLDAHENIDIKIYNPNVNIGKNFAQKAFTLATDFHGLNQRMHNKVFIVDNQVAITGGRNVANEYFGFDHEYNFRDRDVFLAGSVVGDVVTSFDDYWNFEQSVPISKLVKDHPYFENPDFSRLHRYACDPKNFAPEIADEITRVPETFHLLMEEGKFQFVKHVEYISDIPGKNAQKTFLGGGGITQRKLTELANSAKKSILIQTPYLITSETDRAFLKRLVDKGVKVKILTNSLSSNDNLEAFSGYQRTRTALLNTGVEIYEFKPDAHVRQRIMTEHMFKRLPTQPIFGLHAKTMTVDDNIAVVGTYNFDPRSANLNTEGFTVIYSDSITQELNSVMGTEMAPENAWRITKDFNPDNKVSLTKRVGVKLKRIVPTNIL
ncbi:phospholipase D family protein [Vibrio parahaemolyticus]|nr:phospholipase D family protein [Vibrio parahaemolyticus]